MEMSGENSHGEELNLDAEWAEFNASLDESRDMEFLRDKLVFDQIKEDMLAKVVGSGVDTLVHYTDDEEARIYSDYFERRLNELMGGYADMLHDTPELDAAVCKTLIEYFERVDMEYSTIESAVNIAYLLSCSENKITAGLMATDEKKMTQARLWILHGLELDHPWQQMFDSITTGEALDLNRQGDSTYTALALNEKKLHDYERRRMLKLVDRACDIVGRRDDEQNAAIRGLTTSVAMKMFYTVKAGPQTILSDMDINEFLWNLARELPRDNDTLKELVELFKAS